uniref:Protein involved in biosynthesis of mitomycin antibiotics/polyketide fumonisin n=1 Tax=Thermosporothrix sp. COM3 TaxID=2490863 RepID=A0A455SG11_9CHLR|nr:protein involved in biosynthesis of mitomycin antibiotics/polyketide fumonisin [Thermosporothrix sp. COM3]
MNKHQSVSAEMQQAFEQEGFTVARGLFSRQQVDELLATMMAMHAAGPIPELGYYPVPAEQANGDTLKQYPRIIHPHKVNATARRYLIHPAIMQALGVLFGEEALAAQAMFYFKPPHARGQSLHQDNFFLKVEPGTCIAAWVALDPADEENGGLVLVPYTNRAEIQCPHEADQSIFFTNEEVTLPEGATPVPVRLEAGDVLFFNGNIIHGSYPNRSDVRWRRCFIGHYVGVSTTRIGTFYNDLYTADGRRLQREENRDAGPCGTIVDEIH